MPTIRKKATERIVAKNTEVKMGKETIIASLEESMALTDAVEAKVNKRVMMRFARVKEISIKARAAFANFNPSRVPEEIRRKPTYLAPGDNLKTAQNTIMVQDMESVVETQNLRGFSLSLKEQDLLALGFDKVPDNGVEVEVTAAKAHKFLADKMPISSIEKHPSLVSVCYSKKEAETKLNQATNVPAAPDDAPAKPPKKTGKEVAAANKYIQALVDIQMQTTTSPEEDVLYGAKPHATQASVREALDKFELKGGPADVTSYHDFHDLQIAFSHVWTELFDGELARKGPQIIQEALKLTKDFNYSNFSSDRIDTVEEYRDLLDDLQEAMIAIAGEDPKFKRVNILVPEITVAQWASLDESTKAIIYEMAEFYFQLLIQQSGSVAYYSMKMQEDIRNMLKENKMSRLEGMLTDLEQRLKENYVFDVFAENAINFGMLVTYRQAWKPLNYQVGELVSTIPLAPKEVRRYNTKRVVKKTRQTQEMENALSIRKTEASEMGRMDAEIVSRAMNKTSFDQTAEGGVNFAVWNAKGSHKVAGEAAKNSSQTKKEFRESVLKAAEEFKNEHRLEINTLASEEYEEATSGEISNPNDELAVTYLFYELQRRYEINEKIHKLTPVVMVAQKVPYPHEIDEDWLMANDWILHKVILDDSYLFALNYLRDTYTGDEISIEVLRQNWKTQMKVVEQIGQQVEVDTKILDEARKAVEYATQKYASSKAEQDKGFLSSVGDFFLGGATNYEETYRIKMEAAKETLARAEREQQELRSRLASEITALEGATAKYTKALQDQMNRRTAILRLRAHVKDNILYYMQAIWDHEPSDQRFFRMYQLEVPEIIYTPSYTLVPVKKIQLTPGPGLQFNLQMKVEGNVNVIYKKLVEVADLDNPLGYKGNYMMFPLKKNNAVTQYMMQDYLDIHEMACVWDPDPAGNYTLEEMMDIIKCAYELNPAAFEDQKTRDAYRDLIMKRLMDTHTDKEIVIVPTDSLYIETLPGTHPILENFKLCHRAVDVKKVQAEVRHAELENVRLAARALKGEYEDPDIEKKVVIEGNMKNVNVSPDS